MRDLGGCKFCEERAVACCEWPMERFFYSRYGELKPGDRVRRATEHRARAAAVVSYIAKEGSEARLTIGLTIRGKLREIAVLATSPVRRAKEAPCLLPVCESHLRCVEPGVEYCADHWTSWEAVA